MKESCSSCFDNPINGVKLIENIKKHPCLYNNTLIDYCKRDTTEKAWNEVAEAVHDTVNHCKRKWKNYRTCFLRQHKQETEDSGIRKRPYYLKDKMKFILPFIKTGVLAVPDEFSVFEDEECEEDEDDTNEFGEDEQIIEVEPHLNNQDTVPEFDPVQIKIEPVSKPTKKRKREDTNEVDPLEVTPQAQQNQTDFEARKMFVLSLLPEIYELTESRMRKFKRKVLELIDDISTQP